MHNKSIYKTIVKRLPVFLKKQLPKKVAVISITEKTSRELNRTYRKKDKPTNVLSFKYGADYGEILVCSAIIRREAKEQGHSYRYQMTWMVLHGMLHLAGWHHERSRVATERVDGVERNILAKIFGIK